MLYRATPDLEPPPATCDVCRHTHACYVGGAPSGAAWERHVCHGCLIRAGASDGFASCSGGILPASPARSSRHA